MQRLFDTYAGLALSRQRDLATRLGTAAWSFDMGAGTMTFTAGGRAIVTRCQILGTESAASQTWLWGWANAQSGIPAALLEAGQALRAHGEQHGVAELTTRSLPLAAWDGHALAMIASGMTACAGYYRGPYDGGALYVLLTGPELVTPVAQPLVRLATIMPELIAQHRVVDHRQALRGLAAGLGLTCLGEDELEVRGAGEGRLVCRFDAQGRLVAQSGVLA